MRNKERTDDVIGFSSELRILFAALAEIARDLRERYVLGDRQMMNEGEGHDLVRHAPLIERERRSRLENPMPEDGLQMSTTSGRMFFTWSRLHSA